MRQSATAIAGLVLLAIGYFLGSLNGNTAWAFADDEKSAKTATKKDAKKDEGPKNPILAGLTEETQNKLKNAATALKAAQEALKYERKFTSATQGLNVTSILLGGIDSKRDLELGQGVDPETFCALYANMADDSVAKDLSHDEEGRLKYKDRVVRMYSIDKLRKLYAYRSVITGEEVPLSGEEAAAKEREAKKAGEPKAAPKGDEKKAEPAKE